MGLVLRFIRKNRWENKNPDSEDDVATAAADFKLRPNENALSFYLVLDEEEGRRIATAFKMIQMDKRPDFVDFMVLPRSLLAEFGVSLKDQPEPKLPAILSSRHLETVGPQHEAESALIRKLLDPSNGRIFRVKREEAIQVARTLVAEDPDLLERLGAHWRKAIGR